MTEKRVALSTGCGKQNGIGAATARRLAGDGVIVAASDVASAGVENDNAVARAAGAWQGLDTLVAEIEAAGGEASSLTGDVATLCELASNRQQAEQWVTAEQALPSYLKENMHYKSAI